MRITLDTKDQAISQKKLRAKIRSGKQADSQIAREMKRSSLVFRDARSLRALARTKNPNDIVQYYLSDIFKIAQERYRPNNRYSLLDLVGEASLALSELVQTKIPHPNKLNEVIENQIRESINNFILIDKAHELNTQEFPTGSHQLEDDPIADLQDKWDTTKFWETISKIMESRLSAIEGDRIKRFLGLNGKPESQSEIAGKEGVSKSAIGPSIANGIKKLISHSKAGEALKLLQEIHSRPVRPALGESLLEPNEQEDTDLQYIRERIEGSLGCTLEEFRKLHGLSRDEFSKFISSIYPGIDRNQSKGIIYLSESEKKELQANAAHRRRNVQRAKSAETIVGEARSAKLSLEEVKVRLREFYFPLFISDKAKCLQLLESEVARAGSINEQELFSGILNFYLQKVPELKVAGLQSTLDDYQKVDALIMAPKNSYVIAHDMGVGKSVEAITYALMKKAKKVLVISSKSGASVTWPKELNKHLTKKPFIYSATKLKTPRLRLRGREGNPSWSVVGYSFARQNIALLKRLGFDLVILDECHKVNNHNSGQSRAVLSLNPLHKLALSGSLFKNSREELFPVLNWLYPQAFSNRETYIEEYCEHEAGIANLRFDLQDKMTCRLKHQVITLPDVNDKRINIQMTQKQSENYDQLEHEFINWCKEAKINIIGGTVSQAMLLKLHSLRKAAIKIKINEACKLAKQNIKKGHKVVIYTTYIDFAKQVAKKLKDFNPCYLDGATLSKDRKKQIEDFNQDPEKQVFIVTSAGSDSIDLTASDSIIFLNKPLTYADEKQMLDRLHRRGQKKTVNAFHLTVAGTIEEKIDKLIQGKKEEYERTIRNPDDYTDWFIDHQEGNIRELVLSIAG